MSAQNPGEVSDEYTFDEEVLFEDERETLSNAVDDGDNVALVSEPYSGSGRLLDELASRAEGVERVSHESVVDSEPHVPEADVCLVEGCRYLYTRRIGGFEPLEGFIEEVAATDATVVASWNAYSWSYVKRATEVDDVFPAEVEVHSLDTRSIADVLAEEYDVSEFNSDLEELREEGESLINRLPDRLRFVLERRSDNVFDKVSALSGGNLGVARAVFENRLWEKDRDSLDLSYEDAFVLFVAVTKEDVGRDVLEEVVSPRSLEKSLRKLSDAGFVEDDGDRVTLRPERLVDAVEHLERRNLVW